MYVLAYMLVRHGSPSCCPTTIIIIIIIIIEQLVTQHMSVKNKLTNRSCGLATAVSDGKSC